MFWGPDGEGKGMSSGHALRTLDVHEIAGLRLTDAERCHLLVLVDSSRAIALVDAAVDLARAVPARVTLAHVVDTRAAWASTGLVEWFDANELVDSLSEHGERLLARAAERVPGDVPVARRLLVDASAQRAQLDRAFGEERDIVVMARPEARRRGMARLWGRAA